MLAAILFDDATGIDLPQKILERRLAQEVHRKPAEGNSAGGAVAPRHRPYAKGWSIICWSLERRSRVAA